MFICLYVYMYTHIDIYIYIHTYRGFKNEFWGFRAESLRLQKLALRARHQGRPQK